MYVIETDTMPDGGHRSLCPNRRQSSTQHRMAQHALRLQDLRRLLSFPRTALISISGRHLLARICPSSYTCMEVLW
jgi:hypothetical protein